MSFLLLLADCYAAEIYNFEVFCHINVHEIVDSLLVRNIVKRKAGCVR